MFARYWTDQAQQNKIPAVIVKELREKAKMLTRDMLANGDCEKKDVEKMEVANYKWLIENLK
jgi:hypothetical protein